MRTLSVKQAFLKKFKTFEFDGIWKEVMNNPETTGGWIIYGDEKQGKSTFAIMLANYLTKFGKVLYISAEEGVSQHFISVMGRMGVDANNQKLKLLVGDFEMFKVDTYRYIFPLCKKFQFNKPQQEYPPYNKGQIPYKWVRNRKLIKERLIAFINELED